MKIDTLGPLIDVHPIFEALAELKDNRGLYDKPTQRFIRAKLKKCIDELRGTVEFIDKELQGLDEMALTARKGLSSGKCRSCGGLGRILHGNVTDPPVPCPDCAPRRGSRS